MRVALVSVDPIALGCSRPVRNLGIHQLAAYARRAEDLAGCRIDAYDWVLPNFGGKEGACAETRRLAGHLVEGGYDLVGFSTKIWNYYHVHNLSRLVKAERPDARILAGGYQVMGDRFPRLMLGPGEPFDFLVTGEGEEPFVHLMRSLLGRAAFDDCPGLWMRRPDGEPVLTRPGVKTDLDLVPTTFDPEADEDFEGRLVVLEASRGCPYQCHFCEWAATSARTFPLERVFWEIDHVMSRGGNRLLFADGTFNLDRPRRFHPILEYLIERQRHYAGVFGPDFARTGQIGLELRPELITDRCAELLEEMVGLSGETFYQFGLQTVGELAGKLSGRPFREDRWIGAVDRLGPRSRAKTGIDLIADLPGNDLEAVAESHRVAVRIGARGVALWRLFLLPGTRLESDARNLGIEFDPLPPHRVSRWLDRSEEDVRELVGFGSLCVFLTNRFLHFWNELEGLGPADVNFTSVALRFDEWLRARGEAPEIYRRFARLADFYSESETAPEYVEHRTWLTERLPPLFAEFARSEPTLAAPEIRDRLEDHLAPWLDRLARQRSAALAG